MKKHKKLPNRLILLHHFTYDPLTGKLTKTRTGKEVGWTDDQGYRRFTFQKVSYCVHRIVYYMYHGVDPKQKVVDHCNGDKSDNRISNLRCVKQSINIMNQAATREKEGVPIDLFARVDAQERYERTLSGADADF